MTLHQLEIFQAIAKHLNITKAGQEISISQPSVSKQLKQLEDDLGVKLHFKIGHGIQLTKEGHLLQDMATAVFGHIEDLKKIFRKGDIRAESMAVGGAQSPSMSLLPEIITAFQERHPAVEITLRTGNSRTIEDLVEQSEVEIGLVTTQSRNPGIAVQYFCSREAVAVLSPTHPLAKSGKLNEEELANAPFIVRRTSRIARQLEAKGLKLNIAMRCDSSESLRSLVESGAGIGLFFRESIEPSLRAGHLKGIEMAALKKLDFRYFIIRKNGRILSRNAQHFLALLGGWSRKMKPAPVNRTPIRLRIR